jgi:hypothetical protein
MNSDAGGWLWLLIDVGFVVTWPLPSYMGSICGVRARETKPSSAFVTKRREKPTVTRMGSSQPLSLATNASDTSKFA